MIMNTKGGAFHFEFKGNSKSDPEMQFSKTDFQSVCSHSIGFVCSQMSSPIEMHLQSALFAVIRCAAQKRGKHFMEAMESCVRNKQAEN